MQLGFHPLFQSLKSHPEFGMAVTVQPKDSDEEAWPVRQPIPIVVATSAGLMQSLLTSEDESRRNAMIDLILKFEENIEIPPQSRQILGSLIDSGTGEPAPSTPPAYDRIKPDVIRFIAEEFRRLAADNPNLEDKAVFDVAVQRDRDSAKAREAEKEKHRKYLETIAERRRRHRLANGLNAFA